MPHDEVLTDRVRALLKRREGVTEKAMSDGVCFMVNGNMCCGVANNDLVLRLGEQGTAEGLQAPHTRPFEMSGRTMKTLLYVSPEGLESGDALEAWVERAVRFVRILPAAQEREPPSPT